MNNILSPLKISSSVAAIAALFFAPISKAAAQMVVDGSVSLGSQPTAQVAVDPATDMVYLSGGYAQGPLMIVNVTNKNSPAVVTTLSASAGGVTVNPALNRFYTSGGGIYTGSLLVYNGLSNTQITSESLGYCGGQFDFDAVHNLVYMIMQCGGGNDPLFVFNGTSNTEVAGPLGCGGAASTILVNPATGNSYFYNGVFTRVFGPSPGFSVLTNLTGAEVLGVNPGLNLLYVPSGTNLLVLNGSTHAVVATINVGLSVALLGVNTNLNRLYASDGTSTNIAIINGAANTVVGSFSLGAGVPTYGGGRMCVDATAGRLYLISSSGGTQRLWVVEDDTPGPPTLTVSLYAGLTISAQVGTTNQIQYSTNLAGTNWITLTNIILPTNPYLYIDTSSPATQPERFYRSVLLP